jgi:hypothetical protein
VDNLEHLSWTLEKSASYSLQVYRFEEGGLASENFALAARVLKGQAAGVMQSLSVEAADSYALAMAAPVPEPGGLLVGAGVFALGMRRRRR